MTTQDLLTAQGWLTREAGPEVNNRFFHRPTPSGRYPKRRNWASFYVVDAQTDCWNWVKAVADTGYGVVYFDGKLQQAHRVFYKALVGEIPQGKELDHTCRNRRCVNPKHLEPVTRRVNTRRGAICQKNLREAFHGQPMTDRQAYFVTLLISSGHISYHAKRGLVRRGWLTTNETLTDFGKLQYDAWNQKQKL